MNEPTIKPTSDIVVRYLLGSSGHEELLLDFINSHLLEANLTPVESVEIRNPFNFREFTKDKLSELDVKAKAYDRRVFNVEIQIGEEETFVHRSLYYWAELYREQLHNAENYEELYPAICINLLEFTIFDKIPKAHTCFVPREIENPEYILTDAFQIHFYELPKYTEKYPFTKPTDKWGCFFTCAGRNDKEDIMEILLEKEPVIRKAYDIYSRFKDDPRLREAYLARERKRKDEVTALFFAEKRGREEGREEGREKGREEGLESQKLTMQTIMRTKFGDTPIVQQIHTFVSAVDNLETLQRLITKAALAKTAEEVLAELKY